MMGRFVWSVVVSSVLAGCASLRASILAGAGTGAASGAMIGAASVSGDRGQGALVGAGIGAVVGSIASYLIHNGLGSRDAATRKETLFGLEKFGVSAVPKGNSSVPSVSFQVVEEQKIETHRQGNKIIEGHRIWVLSDDSGVLLNSTEENPKLNKK